MPWARDPATSFPCTADDTRSGLEAAGFRVLAWQETTADATAHARRRAGAAPSLLGIHLLLGPVFQTMARNIVRNDAEDRARSLNAVLGRGDG